LTLAPASGKPIAMTDPNDLLRELAECIEDARDIIEGVNTDEQTRNDWLADADQLLIAYDDHRRLARPAPLLLPVAGGRPKPQP
jgi:hypothetical protein